LEKPEVERANVFYDFVKKLYAEDKDKFKTNEVANQIKCEADRLELGDMTVMILAEVLWNKPESILELMKSSVICLRKFSDKNTKAQMHIIGAAEKTIDRWQDVLMPKAVHIYKALYDLDIVDESVFLQWSNKGPSKRYVSRALDTKLHAAMRPFIQWLKEADEESSEEDEENEDDSEESSSPVVTSSIPALSVSNGIKAEDDINIDDI